MPPPLPVLDNREVPLKGRVPYSGNVADLEPAAALIFEWACSCGLRQDIMAMPAELAYLKEVARCPACGEAVPVRVLIDPERNLRKPTSRRRRRRHGRRTAGGQTRGHLAPDSV